MNSIQEDNNAVTTNPETDLRCISVVVIGRNEGERLTRCLESIRVADYPQDKLELIYVDSDSTDDSCTTAQRFGAKVVPIKPKHRSAASGRNAGLSVAKHDLIQFLDGDTILNRSWFHRAVEAMRDPKVAAVTGRREEIGPHSTIYNFWMHHDWYMNPGEIDTCGGDVLFRRDVLLRVGGYDASLIAGEERDLCFRLIRDHQVALMSLDHPMTLHDAGMTRFVQYWRRCFRSGYAYAQVSARYPNLLRWRYVCVRNAIHSVMALMAVALSVGLWTVWPAVIWILLVCLAIGRDAWRCRHRISTPHRAILYAMHHYLSKLPTIVGHLAYYRRHLFGGPKQLIEYRGERVETQTSTDTPDTQA